MNKWHTGSKHVKVNIIDTERTKESTRYQAKPNPIFPEFTPPPPPPKSSDRLYVIVSTLEDRYTLVGIKAGDVCYVKEVDTSYIYCPIEERFIKLTKGKINVEHKIII